MKSNLVWTNEEPDPVLLRGVLEILAPIHNHNYTRGREEHRDPILGE
jgi:hypothetical protein